MSMSSRNAMVGALAAACRKVCMISATKLFAPLFRRTMQVRRPLSSIKRFVSSVFALPGVVLGMVVHVADLQQFVLDGFLADDLVECVHEQFLLVAFTGYYIRHSILSDESTAFAADLGISPHRSTKAI